MTPVARVFSDRFAKRSAGCRSFVRAITYGAVLHYLKAVQARAGAQALTQGLLAYIVCRLTLQLDYILHKSVISDVVRSFSGTEQVDIRVARSGGANRRCFTASER
jgi:hypothetical protein